jgi:hypothetical protein
MDLSEFGYVGGWNGIDMETALAPRYVEKDSKGRPIMGMAMRIRGSGEAQPRMRRMR